MLNFWYSEHCSREVKLVVSVLTCIVIYLCAEIQRLPSFLVGAGVILGMLIHLSRQMNIKMTSQKKIRLFIEVIYLILPFVIMLILVIQHTTHDRLASVIQGFGFILIGFFLASIHSQRAKRYE
jgi:flagellar biosynthesis protein FlhB